MRRRLPFFPKGAQGEEPIELPLRIPRRQNATAARGIPE
jgi:hypothetical protein